MKYIYIYIFFFSDGQPDPKKMAAINDPIGAQLKAIADQQRAQQTQQAVQAAANAAAQINAKLGIQSQGGPPANAMPEVILLHLRCWS